MNKFLKKFLEIGAVLLIAGVIFAPPIAAVEDVNLYLKVYEDDAQVSKVMTESDSEDKQKSKNRDLVAMLVSWYKTMFGLDGAPKAVVAEAIQNGELRPELQYGVVRYATDTYVSAFFYSPSVSIPNYYADMLLPDVLNPASSTAYAAATDQPDNRSATEYLKSMGINKLWGITFGLAMLILVLVLMVAGFMIMFRSKAGGQTVVTVTMALQNVIIGALLALASYAIGGVFLNISKYLILLIGTLFAGFMSDQGLNVIYLSGPWNLTKDFFITTIWGSKDILGTATGAVQSWGDSIAQGWAGFTQGWQDAKQTVISLEAYLNGLSSGLSGTAELLRNTIAYPFVFMGARVILGGVILVAAIRIFWTVLSTYIKMVVDIVIAPLVFMISALPGKQSGYTNWLNRMFKNAITVPIMFAFVNIAAYLSLSVASAQGGCSNNLITCISAGAIPVGQSTGTDWLFSAMGPGGVIAAVMLNMVPTMPAFVEDLFSGKSSGGPSKAWEGVKKNLQGLPVFGGLIQ